MNVSVIDKSEKIIGLHEMRLLNTDIQFFRCTCMLVTILQLQVELI